MPSKGGEGGQQPHMATCRLFLFRIQTASRPPQGMKHRMLPIGGCPFKDSLHVQCKVARKDWCWNGVFHQHQKKTCLKVFCKQFSACNFQESFRFSYFFPDFEYELCLVFNVKTFPCLRRPHPLQQHQQPEHCFKWSVAFVIRTITSYYLISATGLTQLPGTLFHGVNAFVFLSWNK